ncbi:GNAT family N-acetyltransferase [Clostridium sp. D2Q-11]|uniref:GNAT family N-acetyltransferase n=1 Tax=Anaeromonas frigoriresistens TaxID=2683708 RepID=A0A942UQT4_9FIRM|nr:GNAT family N-acetyltransferase [Anaeromonas frigoriresistens]MBS4537498.1 GNAT family N-acetyltransferase [Anaeromonas frigoriresistens]
MKKIEEFTKEIKRDILDFLYKDELFNVFIIHFIENEWKNIGELYISEENKEITGVLHMKFDGNSYFTNFYTKDDKRLKEIAQQIESLNYKRVLLAGKLKDVRKIIELLDKEQDVTPNIYYKFELNSFNDRGIKIDSNFRRAEDNNKDISKIKRFLVGFFKAETPEEINNITNEQKILEELKTGIYFLEYKNETIGMARFSSITQKYMDITTVYIDPKYQKQGFGRELMKGMIRTALSLDKIPVTQTSKLNIGARKTYESLDFIKQEDYAFEFIK